MTDVAQILGMDDRKGGGDPPPPFAAASSSSSPPAPPPSADETHGPPSRALQKLQGKSREVLGLLDTTTSQPPSNKANSVPLPPAVPTFPPKTGKLTASPNEEGAIKVGNRWIKIQTPARKWAWAPFSSTSRTDGTLFHHWVRRNVEYPDYPYARFDIHLDPVSYTDDEYYRYLWSDAWTKSETDRLMELARRHEMRWPVIYDRWIELFYLDAPEGSSGQPPKVGRKIEDLQFRFYQVAAILNQVAIKLEASTEAQMLAAATPDPASGEEPKAAMEHLLYETAAARQLAAMNGPQQPLIACPGNGTSNKVFDLEHERQRRLYLEALWNRTKAEETEERELRKELKQIEAQLRKIKKSGAHILAARRIGIASTGASTSAPSSRNNSRSVSPINHDSLAAMTATMPLTTAAAVPSPTAAAASSFPAMLDEAFASTSPVAMSGTPYLQSGRLVPPAAGGSTGLNKSLLTRMDALLGDLKIPEKPLPTKRVCDMYDSVRKDILSLLLCMKNVLQKEGLVQSKRLRFTGDVRMTEESVMGIAPPAPAPSVPAATSGTATAAAATNSSTGVGGGTGTTSTARPNKTKTSSKGGGGKTVSTSSGTATAKTKGTSKQKSSGEDKTDGKSRNANNNNNNNKDATAASGGTTAAASSGNTGKLGTAARPSSGKQPGTTGKQVKKTTTKRKRKADAVKSTTPPPPAGGTAGAVASSLSTTVTTASATGTTFDKKAGESSTTGGPASTSATTGNVTQPRNADQQQQQQGDSQPPKSTAKKRPRKNQDKSNASSNPT